MDPNKIRMSRIAQHRKVRFHGDPDDADYPHGGGGGGRIGEAKGGMGGPNRKISAEQKKARGILDKVTKYEGYNKTRTPRTPEQEDKLRAEHRAMREGIHDELSSRGYEMKSGTATESAVYVKGSDTYEVSARSRSVERNPNRGSLYNNMSEFVLGVRRR